MKKVLLVLFACFALITAACGGSDDGDGGSDNGSESDTPDKGDPDSDFCDLARKFSEDFEDTASAETPEDQKAVFEDLRSAIDQLEDEAPDEIEDDVKIVADAFRESDDLLKKYDYDFTKVPEEEAQAISLQSAEVTEASDRVESYFERTCGIDSDGDGDTDGEVDSSGDTTGTSTDDGSGTSGEEQAPDDTTDTTAEGE
jgi:hypothetical protein